MKKRFEKGQRFEPNSSMEIASESGLSFSLVEAEDSTAATKQFNYTAINEGTRNEKLSFTTSQRFEYELISKKDGTIRRYSDGKNFLQVLKDMTISPQEKLSYTISLPSLENGDYSLTVYLAARGMGQSRQTVLFSITK